MTDTYYKSEHKGEVIDRMIKDHLEMENKGLDAETIERLNEKAVRARESSSMDVTIGGVTLRVLTTTQFAELVDSYDSDTLYAVIDDDTQAL